MNLKAKTSRNKSLDERYIPIATRYSWLNFHTNRCKRKIEELIENLPEDKFQYGWENLPTGFSNTVTPMFPEPIYIPAVKDFSDEIKTKESTSFGKLIKILFKTN